MFLHVQTRLRNRYSGLFFSALVFSTGNTKPRWSGIERSSAIILGLRAVLAAALGCLELLFDLLVHRLDRENFLMHIQLAVYQTELSLSLFDVLPNIAPLVMIMLQPIWQSRASQVSQNTGHNGVDGTECSNRGVWPACCTERGDGGCDNDLNCEAGIDEDTEKLVALGGLGLKVDDSFVDADIVRAAVMVALCHQSWSAVDTRQGAEGEEFVIWGHEKVCVCRYHPSRSWSSIMEEVMAALTDGDVARGGNVNLGKASLFTVEVVQGSYEAP